MNINFGYYQSWAGSRASNCYPVSPQNISAAANKYTHIAYAFAGVNSSDQISPWNNDFVGEEPNYKLFNSTKASNPGLKTFISVGGASFTQSIFSGIASSSSRRATFASSVIAFLNKVMVNEK
jgi:GH18 family chitinase